MVNQKEENTNFQEQLTELKKEKSVLNQMIVATSKRTEMLNEEVGFYWSSLPLSVYFVRSFFHIRRFLAYGDILLIGRAWNTV